MKPAFNFITWDDKADVVVKHVILLWFHMIHSLNLNLASL